MSKFYKQQPLTLASGSASRKTLLDSLGLDFKIVISHCDEDHIKQNHTGTCVELAVVLAKVKALAVSRQHPDHFIIAADQLCVLGSSKIFDKPQNHATAKEHLKQLSGQTHQQISACCLVKNNSVLWEIQDIALLTMRKLDEKTIEAYLTADKLHQKDRMKQRALLNISLKQPYSASKEP